MNIIDRSLQRLGYTKAQAKPPDFLRATARNERYTVPNMELPDNQLKTFQQLSWITDAVGYVSKYAATIELGVLKRLNEDTEEIINHDFEALLQRPNPVQSRFRFLESTFANYMLAGNAYWHINTPSEGVAPLELYSLPSNRIRPIPGGDIGMIKGYEWDAGNGETVFLEEWEIVHFADYHPRNMFVGMSRVESIAKEIETDSKAALYDMNFYGKDNAKPEGMLNFKGRVPDDVWNTLQRRFTNKHGGTKRSIAMSQGAEGVDYIQLALNHADMDFINNRTFKKEQIYNHFAPGLASVLAVNATEANARTGKNTLLEFAIWPMLVNVHEQITNKIMSCYGDNLVARFKDVRQVDRDLELDEQSVYEKTHTIDEIRSRWYNEEGIGDERGGLLPVQVNSASVPTFEEPTPQPNPPPAPPDNDEIEQENDEEDTKTIKAAIKAIADIEDLFKQEVQDLIDGANSGAVDRKTFTARLRGMIARFSKSAYREGLRTGGIEDGELSDDDDKIIIAHIKEQQQYAKGLAAQLYTENGLSETIASTKTTLWYNKSIEPAFQKGVLSADADGMYEWQLGHTEEHCDDCLRLQGQRHRLSEWHDSGWLPKASQLACGGFNCDCELLPTTGRARGKLGASSSKAEIVNREEQNEIAAWKRFVHAQAKKGKLFADMREFVTDHISEEKKCAIIEKMKAATDSAGLKAAFYVEGANDATC